MSKISTQAKTRLIVFGPIAIISIIIFVFTLCSSIKSIYVLEKETNKLNKMYDELLNGAETLKVEINKLHDPEYLAKFARENYDYSKDGELIIKIVDTEDKIEGLTDKEYNNKVILIVMSFILLFMVLVYIITKSINFKKNDKKKLVSIKNNTKKSL